VISAVILAAGKSERMGRAKMGLLWGTTTVLGQVIRVLNSAGVSDILAVSGAARDAVQESCRLEGAREVFNESFADGEMLSSIQAGLRALTPKTRAALIVLGDQPQIQASTVDRVLRAYEDSGARLVAPSYNMRRGHPWLVDRALWEELLRLGPGETARGFLSRHGSAIRYVEIESPTVVEDLDTPDDYLNSRP